MQNSKLWMRLGDNGEYNEFGSDLDAVADVLIEAGVGPEIFQRHGGIHADGYSGCNYISLYWGDDDAEHERDLTDGEFDRISGALENA